MAAVTWSVKVVPRQTSQAPPVLLALPNRLVNQLLMVYLGASNLKIRHAVFAGGNWTAEGSSRTSPARRRRPWPPSGASCTWCTWRSTTRRSATP